MVYKTFYLFFCMESGEVNQQKETKNTHQRTILFV